jgi:hypothetical protein
MNLQRSLQTRSSVSPSADRRRSVSLYLFTQDLVDEGATRVLDLVQDAGANSITVAASYHHGRDVFPHNPRHRVVFHEGGTVYFHPDLARYEATSLKPKTAAIALAPDPLAEAIEAAARRGMAVSAWTVFLHNSRLGLLHPECTVSNAFGDHLIHYLCPANPDVISYATGLATDIARYGVRSIAFEALSYLPFDHGYHHERNFLRLSPTVRYLMGLCFCSHCIAAANGFGVDGDRVQSRVRELIEGVCESATSDVWEDDIDVQAIRAEADGELGRFLDAREGVVTALVREVATAVHSEAPRVRTVFLDLSGGVLGYADGKPRTDATSTTIAWRDGVSLQAVAEACDGVGVLGYFADIDRFVREVAAYREIVPSPGTLEVLLRPMMPDTSSPDALAAKVAALVDLGEIDISFYHYGFMRLESLGWIRTSLSSMQGPESLADRK